MLKPEENKILRPTNHKYIAEHKARVAGKTKRLVQSLMDEYGWTREQAEKYFKEQMSSKSSKDGNSSTKAPMPSVEGTPEGPQDSKADGEDAHGGTPSTL